MGKISKAFTAFGILLRRPWLLNHVLNDEGVKQRYVARKYNFRQGFPVIDIKNFFSSGEMIVEPFAFLDGGSLPSDLALLKSLCLRNKVEDYLEIGTWRGESVANVAATGARCITVNLPDQEMKKMGLRDNYIKIHRFFSEKLPNVKHIQANSHNFDFSSLSQKFDLIFIDGDHHSKSIALDTKTAFSLLKNDKSIIVWHDYGISPETPRYEALAGILDGCPVEAREKLFHVSNTICAIYTNENFPARKLIADEKPAHYFSVKLNIREIE